MLSLTDVTALGVAYAYGVRSMSVSAFPRAWFITGVKGGLGHAIARAALARGDVVSGTVRRAADAEWFTALAPGQSFGYVADVTHEAAVRATVEQSIASMGRIDVVVNNAGYGLFGAAEELTDAEVRAQFDVNVFGVWHVLRAVLPHLRVRRSGHVINISSLMGMITLGGAGAYCASKFALEGLTESLAYELAPFGVAVTLVEPGPFRTDFAGASAHFASHPIDEYTVGAGSQKQRLAKLHGAQPGDPRKLAAAVLKLVDTRDPPMRLVLGAEALQRVRARLAWVQHELDSNESISRGTEHPEPASGAATTFDPPRRLSR